MSRCFPFPPPGYEKKARAANLDLLLKEKHKERKHRKERKDKDKSDSKEKREKDGNKEKHRDKDQKERHKEKKRDKERGKDKQRTTDGQRNVERIADNAFCKLVEGNHSAEEKRFKDEFTRRITGDGKNAETQKVVDLTYTDPKRAGVTLTDRTKDDEFRENKRKNVERKPVDTSLKFVERNHALGDKIFSDDFNRRIRADGKTAENRLVENFTSTDPRGIGSTFTDMAKDNEVRGKSKDRVVESWLDLTDRSGVEVKGKHKERSVEGICKPIGDHTKEKSKERLWEGISKTKEGISKTKEASMGKEKKKERLLQDIDRRKVNIKGTENFKEGEEQTTGKLKDGCQVPDDKIIKSNDRITVKEREKIKLKTGISQKPMEQNPGESGNGLLPTTSTVSEAFLAKSGVNGSWVDPNSRKRKELQMNGTRHDDLRPVKLSKQTPGSCLQLKNGFRSETAHVGIQSDKIKLERVVDINTSLVPSHNKDQKLNEKIEDPIPASNSVPSGSLADKNASPSSVYKKEHKLNGKIEHRPPESKPRPSAILGISRPSPSSYGKGNKANGTPENSSAMRNLKSMAASDAGGGGMSGSEHDRPLSSNNHKSLVSDIACPGASSIERSRPQRDSNMKKFSASNTVIAGMESADHSILSPATNLKPSVPDSTGVGMSNTECNRPPHPDSQFLSQILSVPKMAEWAEFDEQEWLFNKKTSSEMKPSFEVEIDRTPQVWASVVHIEESVETHALPYVIPY